MAKGAREKIKLESSAGTGHFYTTSKNKRTTPEKLQLMKYDPVARKHVAYKENQAPSRRLAQPKKKPAAAGFFCFPEPRAGSGRRRRVAADSQRRILQHPDARSLRHARSSPADWRASASREALPRSQIAASSARCPQRAHRRRCVRAVHARVCCCAAGIDFMSDLRSQRRSAPKRCLSAADRPGPPQFLVQRRAQPTRA